MTVFKLPDLGEGLSEAEIVRWHVKVGDRITIDSPMVSVETAKAVVDVPAPMSGTVTALHAKAGERVETGAPLIEFALDSNDRGADSGTVVGHMPARSEEQYEHAAVSGVGAGTPARARTLPAARALARGLGVDVARLSGSGRDGQITLEDVMRAAGLAGRGDAAQPRPAPMPPAPTSGVGGEELHGLRRAMAQSMTRARDNVADCTVFDDADLHRWGEGSDYSTRVLRAIVAGVRAEPALNGWYDTSSQRRILCRQIDVGIAIDVSDGLLVAVVRHAEERSAAELRTELERLKRGARERTLSPAELRDFTFMLTNYGMLAGRYATPVIVPPAIAILGAGRARDDVIAVDGRVQIHRRLPLSLTFDHRVVTGSEAVRFLAAVIRDLELAQ